MKALLNSLASLLTRPVLWRWSRFRPATSCGTITLRRALTRDGHVRADVVPVAPDVSGFVTEVLVRDNQQVQRGDVLFRIDRARYDIALKQAEAVLLGKRAMLDEANADLARYSALTPGVVVSKQRMDSGRRHPGARPRPPMTRLSRTLVSPSSTSSAARCAPPSMASSPTWSCVRGPISRPARG